MSPERYRGYLRVTLRMMRERQRHGMVAEPGIEACRVRPTIVDTVFQSLLFDPIHADHSLERWERA